MDIKTVTQKAQKTSPFHLHQSKRPKQNNIFIQQTLKFTHVWKFDQRAFLTTYTLRLQIQWLLLEYVLFTRIITCNISSSPMCRPYPGFEQSLFFTASFSLQVFITSVFSPSLQQCHHFTQAHQLTHCFHLSLQLSAYPVSVLFSKPFYLTVNPTNINGVIMIILHFL